MVALRFDAVRRRSKYFTDDTAGEVFLLRLNLDLNLFAGEGTAHKHDAPIDVTRHGVTACDEAIWTNGQCHEFSVGRCPSEPDHERMS